MKTLFFSAVVLLSWAFCLQCISAQSFSQTCTCTSGNQNSLADSSICIVSSCTGDLSQAACFPEDARVRALKAGPSDSKNNKTPPSATYPAIPHELRTPVDISIQRLIVGDYVLTLCQNYTSARSNNWVFRASDWYECYTPVIGFLHREPRIRAAPYLVIASERAAITLSEGHMMFSAVDQTFKSALYMAEHSWNESVLTSAVWISVGNDLQRMAGVSRVEKIRKHEKTKADGFYAPLTESGTMLVDGVYVSCYGTLVQLLCSFFLFIYNNEVSELTGYLVVVDSSRWT